MTFDGESECEVTGRVRRSSIAFAMLVAMICATTSASGHINAHGGWWLEDGSRTLSIDADWQSEDADVPDECRPKAWWLFGETETTREGITADAEAFKRAGFGGRAASRRLARSLSRQAKAYL